MAVLDPATSLSLFSDLALPSLAVLFRSHSGKRRDVLCVLLSFAEAGSAAAQLQAVKRMQAALNDQTLFLRAVAMIVHLSVALDDNALDKYM